MRRPNPQVSNMQPFNFNAPAEIFAVRGRRSKGQRMIYRKFSTGAEAVRHAVEVLDSDTRRGAIVEIDDTRFDLADIEALYHSPDYPLERRKPS